MFYQTWAKPGASLQTPSWLIHWESKCISSHKTDYIAQAYGLQILKDCKNVIIDSKVMAILLNEWILLIGGIELGRVCAQPSNQDFF